MCIPSSNSESEEEPPNNSEAPLVYGDMPAFGDFPETDENLIAHVIILPDKDVFIFTSDEYFEKYVSIC